jgi:uncharacterized protein (DUF58 family)
MPVELLTPEVVACLEGLEVKARTIVEGLLAGEHRGRRSGFSVDFAEHRSYAPGDDVRHLDWKVYGKRDRLYVRQFEQETRLQAWLVMDVSGSMAYRSEGRPLSKLEYAHCLAAAIGWVICQQRDAVGLATFSGTTRRMLHPRSGITGLREIFSTLEAAGETPGRGEEGKRGRGEERGRNEPVHSSPPTLGASAPRPVHPPDTPSVASAEDWNMLHTIAEGLQGRTVVFLFTDGFGDADQLIRVLKHFRTKHCDTRLIQILDPAEVSFPFEDNIDFRSLETGEHRTVMTRSIRSAYLDELHAFLRQLERDVRAQHCAYSRIETTEPLDHALLRILADRDLT